MRKYSKEESLANQTPCSPSGMQPQSDTRSRKSNHSSTKSSPIQHMDRILYQIQQAFKSNIQIQQCYIDIMKRKNNNINSNDIKNIYVLFTQTKANQICIEKEINGLGLLDFDDRLLRRYYARLIQMGIRKISYFWTHLSKLEFVTSHLVRMTKQIYSIFTDIYKLKSLYQHFNVLQLLAQQNNCIQQKIYQFLIDQGYLLSMDEFYRINGVDIVSDQQQYQSKLQKTEQQSSAQPSLQQSQNLIEPKKQQSRNIRISKTKQNSPKQSKKSIKRRSVMQNSPKLSFDNLQKNKTKIKNMLQSLVKQLKSQLEEEKDTNKLDIIEQQSQGTQKISYKKVRDSIDIQQLREKRASINYSGVGPSNFYNRRTSNAQSQQRRKANQKKLSIQLMSYFSNEFKSAITDARQADIQNISELLVTNSTKRKSNQQKIQDPYIHSLKSLQSANLINQQKKRSKLIEMAHKKNSSGLENIYNEVNENSQYSNFHFQRSSILNRQLFVFNQNKEQLKYSNRSTPGLYISFPVRCDSKRGHRDQNFSTNKRHNANSSQQQTRPKSNRLFIRQQSQQDSLFQNQMLASSLTPKYVSSINQTQVNGNNLSIGIISQNAWKKCKEQFQRNRKIGKEKLADLPENYRCFKNQCMKERANLGQLLNFGLNKRNHYVSQADKENQKNIHHQIEESIARQASKQKQIMASCKIKSIKIRQSSSFAIRKQPIFSENKNNKSSKHFQGHSNLKTEQRDQLPIKQDRRKIQSIINDKTLKQISKQSQIYQPHQEKKPFFRIGNTINYTVYDRIRRKVIVAK